MKNTLLKLITTSLATILVVGSALTAAPYVVQAHDHPAEDSSSTDMDHDDDGIMDDKDIDDDGDGFLDCVEKHSRFDSDNDGKRDKNDDHDDSDKLTLKDKDKDGVPDAIESKLTRRDHDNDLSKDRKDSDDDSDGIEDTMEVKSHRFDHDNDGTKDKADSDDDNDGTLDLEETSCAYVDDHDNDGTSDSEDELDDSSESHHSDDANDDSTEVETIEVSITDFAFDSEEVKIHVGDSIRWTNNDTTAHTASEENALFNTGTLLPGESETITFTTAGSYDYFCAFHLSMVGRVVVEE